MHKCKIAALLTCFNRKAYTLTCLQTLRKNKLCEFCFVVTDDDSTDGTAGAIAQMEDVVLLSGDGKLYWNGGMQKSFAYALEHIEEFDYVMLVNDDVGFYPEAIDALVLRSKETNAPVVVGSTCNKKGEMTYGGVRKKSNVFAKFALIPPSKEATECDTFNGNCVLIKKDAFQAVGNLDPAYTHSMSDYDYGMTLRRKGYRIVNAKHHVGVCEDNDTTGSWLDTSLPRKERRRLKEGPKGLPGKDWFHFVKKNYGLFPALYHSLTPYVRILLGK